MAHHENRSEGAAAWTEAQHESFYRSEQPIKALAAAVGVSTSYLAHAADVEQPDAHVSGRLFPALARECSNLAFLDYLESCAGRVAFVVPRTSAGQVSRIVKEFAEFLEALDDGEDIEKEGREAIAAIAAEIERRKSLRAELIGGRS